MKIISDLDFQIKTFLAHVHPSGSYHVALCLIPPGEERVEYRFTTPEGLTKFLPYVYFRSLIYPHHTFLSTKRQSKKVGIQDWVSALFFGQAWRIGRYFARFAELEGTDARKNVVNQNRLKRPTQSKDFQPLFLDCESTTQMCSDVH